MIKPIRNDAHLLFICRTRIDVFYVMKSSNYGLNTQVNLLSDNSNNRPTSRLDVLKLFLLNYL